MIGWVRERTYLEGSDVMLGCYMGALGGIGMVMFGKQNGFDAAWFVDGWEPVFGSAVPAAKVVVLVVGCVFVALLAAWFLAWAIRGRAAALAAWHKERKTLKLVTKVGEGAVKIPVQLKNGVTLDAAGLRVDVQILSALPDVIPENDRIDTFVARNLKFTLFTTGGALLARDAVHPDSMVPWERANDDMLLLKAKNVVPGGSVVAGRISVVVDPNRPPNPRDDPDLGRAFAVVSLSYDNLITHQTVVEERVLRFQLSDWDSGDAASATSSASASGASGASETGE